MADRDLNLKLDFSLNVVAISSATETIGNAVDLKGFEGCNIAYFTTDYTAGVLDIKITECDEIAGSYTDTESQYVLIPASYTAKTINTANTIKRIRYVGKKRYIKVVGITTGGTVDLSAGAIVVKGFTDVPTE